MVMGPVNRDFVKGQAVPACRGLVVVLFDASSNIMLHTTKDSVKHNHARGTLAGVTVAHA